MAQLDDIFQCIFQLENLKKQAATERSHFYVESTATRAIELLYGYARTFREEPRATTKRKTKETPA